ncbi:MAG: transposase [Parcubacteria group bacterium]|nr:transposase [Parcubacteria group bacterium]
MELIHVLNRGVDKRKIFLNEQDYFRFIHDLFEFNDQEPADISSYLFRKQYSVVRRPNIEKRAERKPRKLLVNLLAFCLMPNHYHLFLAPKIKNGVALFMKKLNAGYSRYFNEKYKRSGALFEGKYKRIAIKDEAHFIHLPYYIHCNSLDLITPEWRRGELEDYKKAIKSGSIFLMIAVFGFSNLGPVFSATELSTILYLTIVLFPLTLIMLTTPAPSSDRAGFLLYE